MGSTSKTVNLPLQLPLFPCPPIRRVSNNATARAAVSYSIMDDLAQTPTAMSALEVLKTCPMQWKSLLAALGAADPFDSKLITFDTKNGQPQIPSTISFQIPVSIWNLVVHRCIVDEGASTCVMSTLVWQKLRSPILQSSSTTLRAYDDHPTKAQGILPHVPITLAEKTVLIDIEVFNAQLDYNLLLERRYM